MKFFKRALIVFLALLPQLAWADLPNFISGSGSENVYKLILAALAGFIGVMAIFSFGFLIANGYKLVLARDNPESLTVAKNGILWSAGGFVITLLAFSITSAVSRFLGGTEESELGSDSLKPPISAGAGATAYEQYGLIAALSRIINGMLGIAMVTAVIMVVWSGYKMITSAGNPEQLTQAKTVMKWALAGMVVILFSFSIINGLNAIFGS